MGDTNRGRDFHKDFSTTIQTEDEKQRQIELAKAAKTAREKTSIRKKLNALDRQADENLLLPSGVVPLSTREATNAQRKIEKLVSRAQELGVKVPNSVRESVGLDRI